MSPEHYAVVQLGIQRPPMLPSLFCESVAIGGVGGVTLDFPAWPILIPTKEGIRMCFTHDEHFRDVYLHRGFCGLDASFREQFGYDCPDDIIRVVPTASEEQPPAERPTQGPLSRVDQERVDQQSTESTADSASGSENRKGYLRGITGWVSNLLLFRTWRKFINQATRLRRYFDGFEGDILTLMMIFAYCFSFGFISLLSATAVLFLGVAVINILHFLGYIDKHAFEPPEARNPPKPSLLRLPTRAAQTTGANIPPPAQASQPTAATNPGGRYVPPQSRGINKPRARPPGQPRLSDKEWLREYFRDSSPVSAAHQPERKASKPPPPPTPKRNPVVSAVNSYPCKNAVLVRAPSQERAAAEKKPLWADVDSDESTGELDKGTRTPSSLPSLISVSVSSDEEHDD